LVPAETIRMTIQIRLAHDTRADARPVPAFAPAP
jgi:hypothetical protein